MCMCIFFKACLHEDLELTVSYLRSTVSTVFCNCMVSHHIVLSFALLSC